MSVVAAARAVALACLLLVPVAPSLAAEGDEAVLRDPDFGVVAHDAIGLQRRVDMYQWHRDGDVYRLDWNNTVVDSAGFVPGHENPAEIPLQARTWLAPGHEDANGAWVPLRPDFSALPGNLSATFQPEGDGLGSAANPASPEPGDLRITWHVLHASGAGGAEPIRGSYAWLVLGGLAASLVFGIALLRRRRS